MSLEAYHALRERCVCEPLQLGFWLSMYICQYDWAKQQLSPILLH